jgi:hypothetical protein
MKKTFLENNGQFIIEIPIEWGYKNPEFNAKENEPHSFELYEKSVGCFQITCKLKTTGSIPELIESKKLKSQEIGKANIEFQDSFVPTEKFDIYFWMAVVEDYFIMCKYIYDALKRESSPIKDEIKKARIALVTFLVVHEEDKESFLASDRIDKFMGSLMASEDLSNRAYKSNSSIELVILLANQIDAILRLSLILNYQLNEKTFEIDLLLLHQGETDKPVMEKTVYKRALDEGIIDKKLYDELFDLYSERNKVVHRYIITDIKTKNIDEIVHDYGIAKEKISALLKKLEERQFEEKTGIYGLQDSPNTPPDDFTLKRIVAAVKDKHADKLINKDVTLK